MTASRDIYEVRQHLLAAAWAALCAMAAGECACDCSSRVAAAEREASDAEAALYEARDEATSLQLQLEALAGAAVRLDAAAAANAQLRDETRRLREVRKGASGGVNACHTHAALRSAALQPPIDRAAWASKALPAYAARRSAAQRHRP